MDLSSSGVWRMFEAFLQLEEYDAGSVRFVHNQFDCYNVATLLVKKGSRGTIGRYVTVEQYAPSWSSPQQVNTPLSKAFIELGVVQKRCQTSDSDTLCVGVQIEMERYTGDVLPTVSSVRWESIHQMTIKRTARIGRLVPLLTAPFYYLEYSTAVQRSS